MGDAVAMGGEQQFCLRWNNFQANITSQFEVLRNEEEFVDVTLACDGQRLKAHKVVLSACSPYFKELFTSNPCKHPILFLRDVEFCHLRSLVEFMYAGEVNVAQAQLSSFLRTAESLQIRGLTEAPQHHKERMSPTQNSVQSSSGSKKESSLGRLSMEEEDDEVLSASPPLSPPPAKRACLDKPAQPPLLPQKHEVDPYQDDSPEIIEPKMEIPDYNSDGECKLDGGSMSASLYGLDNSVDGNNTFSSLHGGVDMLPGTSSQNFMTDFTQDSSQGSRRREYRRTVWRRWDSKHDLLGESLAKAAFAEGGLVRLWEGVEVCADQLRAINWSDYKKLTRGLASLLFSPMELATKSVTGQRWARAGSDTERPTKPALDRDKVEAIINHVRLRFPTVTVSMIKQILAYKCKDSALSLRYRGLPGLERQRHMLGAVGMQASFFQAQARQEER